LRARPAIPKSNWANTPDTPPFEACAVTCGITFTYGELRTNTDAVFGKITETSAAR
jgi:hypothetical protein